MRCTLSVMVGRPCDAHMPRGGEATPGPSPSGPGPNLDSRDAATPEPGPLPTDPRRMLSARTALAAAAAAPCPARPAGAVAATLGAFAVLFSAGSSCSGAMTRRLRDPAAASYSCRRLSAPRNDRLCARGKVAVSVQLSSHGCKTSAGGQAARNAGHAHGGWRLV